MSDYTPNTQDDRWLAQHDSEIQAQALEGPIEESAVSVPDILGYRVRVVYVEDIQDAADALRRTTAKETA